MSHSNAGVDAAVDAQSGQHLRIGRHASLQHRGRKAVERERGVAAEVAVEPSGDPPDAPTEHKAHKEKRQPQQQQDIRHLMAQFPGAGRSSILNDAILRLAKEIEQALSEKVQR
jgi:hypothetical protein